MSELIRREELLEHLEACLQNGRPLSGLYDLSEIVHYVKSMPTIAASKWNRVEEELPKEYGNYLAVVNGEVMEVTYSDMSVRDDWQWSTCDAEGFVWIRSEFVTHWMPLPEPPRGVQE